MRRTLSKALIDYPDQGERAKESNKNAVNAMRGAKNCLAFAALLLKDFYLDRILLTNPLGSILVLNQTGIKKMMKIKTKIKTNYNNVIADMTIRGVNLVKLNLIFNRRK